MVALVAILKSSKPNVTGVDGGGIMREAALVFWLGGVDTDLICPLGPLPALVTPIPLTLPVVACSEGPVL